MSANKPIESAVERKILRFTVGVGVAVFLAAWLDWALAFVAPVFTAKFLLDKPSPTRETIYELIVAMIVTMLLGLLLSTGITDYPVPLLVLIGLMMMWGYYLFTDPKWNLFATILILAVLLLPFMAVMTTGVALFLAIGLSFSGVVAIVIFTLVHIYIPDEPAAAAGYEAPVLSSGQRWYAAIRAMLISYPVVCFFFAFQISEALLSMIFIALLSLMITGEKSVKLGAFLVISNAIGGVIALLLFPILGIVPNLLFYTLVITLVALLMATKIYTVPEKAPVYATAFSTLLVLLGSVLMSSGNIDNKMLTRIAQLVGVGVYMIAASYVLETRRWKFLTRQSL